MWSSPSREKGKRKGKGASAPSSPATRRRADAVSPVAAAKAASRPDDMSPSIIAYHKIKQKLSAIRDKSSDKHRTQVAVRLSPTGCTSGSDEDVDKFRRGVHVQDGQTVRVSLPFLNSKEYKFDSVFDETSSNQRVFDTLVSPLVHKMIDGYKCVCVAYGQSGAGKSHTMGTDSSSLDSGCISQACRQLFDFMSADTCRCTWSVSATCLELKDDAVRDLLEADPADSRRGRLRAAGTEALKQVALRSMEDCSLLLRIACRRRSRSSRASSSQGHTGHMVLKFTLTRTLRTSEENFPDSPQQVVSSLTFVDLLGCDKGRSEVSSPGPPKQMDPSLFHLWSAVHDSTELEHNRDSRLLQLMSDWLTGKAHSVLLLHVFVSSESIHETSSSLLLGRKAMLIPAKPSWNDESLEVTKVSQMEEVEKLLESEPGSPAENKVQTPAGERRSRSPKRRHTPQRMRGKSPKVKKRIGYGDSLALYQTLDAIDAELHDYVQQEMSESSTRDVTTSKASSLNLDDPPEAPPPQPPAPREDAARYERVLRNLEDLLDLHSERFRICFHKANKRWRSFSQIHNEMDSFSSVLHLMNDSSQTVYSFPPSIQQAVDAMAREQLSREEGEPSDVEESAGLFARIQERMLGQGSDAELERLVSSATVDSRDASANQSLRAGKTLEEVGGSWQGLEEDSQMSEAVRSLTTKLLQLQTFQATCELKFCKLSVLGDPEEEEEDCESISKLRSLLQALEGYSREMNRAEYERSAGAMVCDFLGQVAVNEKKKVVELSRLLSSARAQLNEKEEAPRHRAAARGDEDERLARMEAAVSCLEGTIANLTGAMKQPMKFRRRGEAQEEEETEEEVVVVEDDEEEVAAAAEVKGQDSIHSNEQEEEASAPRTNPALLHGVRGNAQEEAEGRTISEEEERRLLQVAKEVTAKSASCAQHFYTRCFNWFAMEKKKNFQKKFQVDGKQSKCFL